MADEEPVAKKLRIAQKFHGVRRLLENDTLSDIDLALEDGSVIRTHRAILGASSDVLHTILSEHAGRAWTPDIGSPSTWRWIVDWMYGAAGALPIELLVDAAAVADRMRLTGLMIEFVALDLADISSDQFAAQNLVQQLLGALDETEFLHKVAHYCVSAVAENPSVWDKFWAGTARGASLFLGNLPLPCEADRVRLVGEYMRRRANRGNGDTSNAQSNASNWSVSQGKPAKNSLGIFERLRTGQASVPGHRRLDPDSCSWTRLLVSVQWHRFPTDVLEKGISADVSYFIPLLGDNCPCRHDFESAATSFMKTALVSRCKLLDSHLSKIPTPAESAYVLADGADFVACCLPTNVNVNGPNFGVFAALGRHNRDWVSVALSSSDWVNGRNEHALLRPTTTYFGTDEQTEEDAPWIEVSSSSCSVQPTSIGLKHGADCSDQCSSFVVEGLSDVGGEWQELLVRNNWPLPFTPAVIPIDTPKSETDRFYCRFRLRMTGPNSSGRWQLMTGWFEVYGRFKTRVFPIPNN